MEERKRPDIGCLIVGIGTILFWGSLWVFFRSVL
jgi:hypothetical protein